MREPTTVPEMAAASLALADPAAVAVECGGSTATNAELDALAWGTAGRLRAAGVGPGAVVGVVASPGPRQVAAWLGVLRAGAAFAPLDPDRPEPAGIELLREADVEPGPPVPAVPVDERAPAVVLIPPGGETVVWEQGNLLYAALTTGWLHELGPGARLVASGATAVVEAFACLCSGARLVLTDVAERQGRSFYRAAGCPGFAAEIVDGSLRPVPNTRLDVLGAGDEELPDGVEGDLWVFGPGVPGDLRRCRTGDRAVRGRDGELKLSAPAEPAPPPSPVSASETGRRRAAELFAETLSAAGLYGEAQRAALREPDADFFRLGGHSLLAVGMVAAAARRWNGEVALRDFLAEPTVTGLGALLDTAAAPPSRSPVTADDGWYPALPAQQRLWFLDRLPRLRQAYLVTFVLEYTGVVDAARLAASIRFVLGRHPALRSVFRLDHARRELVYRTDGPAPEVSLVDNRGRSRAELDDYLDEVLWQPFDLADGPPARAAVITSGTGATTVALSASHVVLDGWSLRQLADEIGETYRAAGQGRPPHLPEPVHPADAAGPVEAGKDRLAEVLASLEDAPLDVDLPRDRPRTAEQRTEGATAVLGLGPELTSRLRVVAAAHGCSTFMVLVVLLAAALAERGDQADFLFAFPWAGRDDPGRASAVGMFAGTLLVRADLRGEPGWGELLGRVRRAATTAFAHADVPFDAVAAALEPGRDLSRPPVTPVMVSVLDAPLAAPVLGDGVHGRVEIRDAAHVKYELALVGIEHPDELELYADYVTGLFDRATVTALLADLRRLALELVRSLEATVPEPSTSDLVDVVRKAWADVLARADVDTETSFFDAGGTSLLLIMLLDRLAPLTARELTVADLFRCNTVSSQARLLAGDDRPAPAPREQNRQRLLGAARRPAPGTSRR
ncbi:hypothetical protein DMA12_11735 [Amycolatopsis balhimycina DSM 5908]|uniref:Carrier domain-containing protein n=1 Tax=Amycolatopsis balhimycina DSM 5908 TaxID=1081091 RepID=A0A428WTR5_AMYBA|nr:condensation domain-containing protein [Amycolatopsis balhimycina]RSM46442.1 hypothetical protein DMA12_11735 [Amycolatopsis balhimycina DSM 5908]